MAWSFVASYTGSNKVSGGTVSAATTAAVDDILLVCIDSDSSTAGTVFGASSVSDGTSNVYTLLESITSTATAAVPDVAVYYCKAVSTLTATNVTFTPAQTVTSKGIAVMRFTGGSSTERGTKSTFDSGDATSVTTWTVTNANPLSGDLVLGVAGIKGAVDNSAPADAGDSDTTNGSWSALVKGGTTGGADGTNQHVDVQYKIVTADGSQTWDGSHKSTKDKGLLLTLQIAAAASGITTNYLQLTQIARDTAARNYARAPKGRVYASAQPISIDGDTGTGVDAGESTTATLSSADTGTGADTESLAILATTPNLYVTTQAQLTATLRYTRMARGRVYASAQPISITDQDTGTGLDATGTTTATLSDADTGTGVEAGTAPSATLSGADTGAGLDAESVAVMLVTNLLVLLQAKAQAQWYYRNAAHGRLNYVPLSPPSAPVQISDGDTGSGAETSSITASSSDSDTGTGAETGTIAVSSAETGSDLDAGESIAATLSSSDTGTGLDTESLAILATTPALYLTQMARDTAIWYRKNAPKGRIRLVAQPITVSDADSGTGADSEVSVAISDADTGVGVETEAASAVLQLYQVNQARATAVWRWTHASRGSSNFVPYAVALTVVNKSDSDTGTGVETSSIAATLPDSDTGTGTEGTPTVAFTATETGTGVEGTPSVAFSAADTGSGLDAGSLAASLTGTDTGAGVESGSLLASLPGSDTSAGTEQTTILAALSSSDSSSSTEGATVFTGVSVVDGDTGKGAENFYPPSITPSPPQHGAIWPPPVTRRPFGRK